MKRHSTVCRRPRCSVVRSASERRARRSTLLLSWFVMTLRVSRFVAGVESLNLLAQLKCGSVRGLRGRAIRFAVCVIQTACPRHAVGRAVKTRAWRVVVIWASPPSWPAVVSSIAGGDVFSARPLTV